MSSQPGSLAEVDHLAFEAGSSLWSKEGTTEIRSLSVDSVDEAVALVSFNAELRYEETTLGFGKVERRSHISGPATMLHVDGTWRVADYYLEGRSRRQGFFDHCEGHGERAGLGVSIRAADLRAKSTMVFLTIQNSLDHPVRFFEAGILAKSARMDGSVLGGVDVAPRSTLPTVAGCVGELPLQTKRFHLILLAYPIVGGDDSGERMRLAVRVRLGRKGK